MAYSPETMLHIVLSLEDCTIEDSPCTDELAEKFVNKYQRELKQKEEQK